MSDRSISHRLLTSDVDLAEQESIAKEWLNSGFTALVSTSIAVVGIENPKCHHLVINGYLFNNITMVQAINRLRPKQRNGGASIQIFLPTYPPKEYSHFHKYYSSAGVLLRERAGIAHIYL